MNRIRKLLSHEKPSPYVQERIDRNNMYYCLILCPVIAVIEAGLLAATYLSRDSYLAMIENGTLQTYRYGYLVLLCASVILFIIAYLYRFRGRNSHVLADASLYTFIAIVIWYGILMTTLDQRVHVDMLAFVYAEAVCFGLFSFDPWVLGGMLCSSFALFISIESSTAPISDGNIVNLVILWIVLMINGLAHSSRQEEHFRMEEELNNMSMNDALTGLRNRYALRRDFGAFRNTSLIALIMDVDNFKQYNDKYGHAMGDKVLISFADTLKRTFGSDQCYRYGGDEFLVIMTGTMADFLNRLKELQDIPIQHEEHDPEIERITFSGGYVGGRIDKDLSEVRTLIHEADVLLYEAKKKGKGNVLGGNTDAARSVICQDKQ